MPSCCALTLREDRHSRDLHGKHSSPPLGHRFKYRNKLLDTSQGQQARQASGLDFTECRSSRLQTAQEAGGLQARELPRVDTRPGLWSGRESSLDGGEMVVGQNWGVLKSRQDFETSCGWPYFLPRNNGADCGISKEEERWV